MQNKFMDNVSLLKSYKLVKMCLRSIILKDFLICIRVILPVRDNHTNLSLYKLS